MMPTGRHSVAQTMLSIPHMIVVFVIVLVVFGPQKLPELARSLGKLMAEFRKASTDFKSSFENEMRDLERQAAEVERKKRELQAAQATQPQPATLATPSGAETQPGLAALAPAAGEKGATEALLITPVAESVARSSEAAQHATPEKATSGEADIVEAPSVLPPSLEIAPENGHKPDAAASSNSLDAPHDYKQPA
jgi:sec-independent protein translocase protein TatB